MKSSFPNHRFGHRLEWKEDPERWVYADTGEDIRAAAPRRCPGCDQFKTKDGHDPCIAKLPGVTDACCGHGVADGYIAFANGRTVRGRFRIKGSA